MFSQPRSFTYLAYFACLLGLAGCPVDERPLEPVAAIGGQAGAGMVLPSGGSSGAPDGGRSGASVGAQGPGGSSERGEGGAAGAVGQVPITIDGCADLDGNGISDCAETKAVNAEFSSDIANWTAEAEAGDSFSTALAWDAENAWGSDPSGSAKITVAGTLDFNGATLRAATQCLPMAALQLLIVYANVQIDRDQDPAGSAEIDVSFFDTTDCSGPASSSFSTPSPSSTSAAGSWLTLHAGSLSVATTKSALVKLGVVKPFRAQSLTARFDNILVRVQQP